MERSRLVSELLKDHLGHPRITDICINGSQGLFMDLGDGMETFRINSSEITEESLKDWVLDQLSKVGKTWDAKLPFIDASLPSGHRLHVAFPPVASQGILVSLRRIPSSQSRVSSSEGQELAKDRWKGSPLFSLMTQIIGQGDSVIISGATGSGKTTLANDLLCFVPEKERIVALEDTKELCPSHSHFVSLVSRPPNSDGYGEVTLRTLLRQTLRMRPDRIILGECRGAEVLELLQALNTGHRGAMATLHANSPREALRRIELLCLLASSGSVPISCIRELLAMGVQWIAQVKRLANGRKIQELWKVEGREGDTILLRQMLESDLKWKL